MPQDPEPSQPDPPFRWVRFCILSIVFGLALYGAYYGLNYFYKRSYFTDSVPTPDRIVKWLQQGQDPTPGGDYAEPVRRIVLFVGIFWLLLFFAVGTLCYEYIRYLVRGGRPGKRFLPYVMFRFVVLTAGGTVVLCLLYGYWIEPKWLQVKNVRIESPKLAHGSQVRIAFFSDLHIDRHPGIESRLQDAVTESKPDVIVFAGDAMNAGVALGPFQRLLLELSRVAPVYLVKGNQDGGYFWDPQHIYEGTNAHELKGEVESLNVRGNNLWISGAPDGAGYGSLAKNPPPPSRFSIFVYHRPDDILEVAKDHYDLYLCGHTHGGQIALPFYGALITYSKFDKRFEAGLYEVDSTHLYVNRGIGFAKWPQPQARFFARPELTVIDLVGN